MLSLVGNIGSEVPANNAVPGGVVLLVKLLLNVGGNVLLDVELLQSHVGAIDGVLLHLLVHVCVFDHGFSLGGRHYQLNTIKSNQFCSLFIPTLIYPVKLSQYPRFGGSLFYVWMCSTAAFEIQRKFVGCVRGRRVSGRSTVIAFLSVKEDTTLVAK